MGNVLKRKIKKKIQTVECIRGSQMTLKSLPGENPSPNDWLHLAHKQLYLLNQQR